MHITKKYKPIKEINMLLSPLGITDGQHNITYDSMRHFKAKSIQKIGGFTKYQMKHDLEKLKRNYSGKKRFNIMF